MVGEGYLVSASRLATTILGISLVLLSSMAVVEGFQHNKIVSTGLFGRSSADALVVPTLNSNNNNRRMAKNSFLRASTDLATTTDSSTHQKNTFDVDMALFCAGLAFDSYVEPDPDSSRWERGSKGMNVAFVSSAYTRNLYKGMVEVTPIECTDLPEEDDTLESITTGNGVDVCLMCAVVEGALWKEDLKVLDKDPNHNGVMSLSGSAHVGRSRTAWANVNENKSKASKRKTGKGLPYHVPKGFMKPSKAIWPEDERPFYLYVQDPENVRLVFSIFDDDVIGDGSIISSTSIALKKCLPRVGEDLIETIKTDLVQQMIAEARESGDASGEDLANSIDVAKLNARITAKISQVANADYKWEGELKMSTKPKIENKNGQMAAGAAAGAMVAGPLGAAAGAAFGAFYEGQARGVAGLRLRYLPVPPGSLRPKGSRYEVLGGLPGINWGKLYELNLDDSDSSSSSSNSNNALSDSLMTLGGTDLEFCFFINHDQTGASVGVYRSLEEKRIVVSFRGTCQPIDLMTDASIFQVPWVEGKYDEQALKNVDHKEFPMVHVGFRKSMDSISRRLKTLVLAAVGEGESITNYEVLVTGHSLGGALATLFTADIAEAGIDAGRSLPSKAPSEPWWKGIAGTFNKEVGDKLPEIVTKKSGPPRPKSLKMYNFGSPRAGNQAFANEFEKYLEKGYIDEAYRIVNSQDIITRVPRPTGMLNVDYEHCGKTVLIEDTLVEGDNPLWIEGESDFDRVDPVRDIRSATKGILSEGMLLDDLVKTYLGDGNDVGGDNDGEEGSSKSSSVFSQLGAVASRLQNVDIADLTSMVGIDKTYANRELQLAQSFVKGESLAHHLEDSYYMAMGRAVGFNTTVGEDIVRLEV